MALFATLTTTLALGWACLPYEVDNSGTYGLLADANLWCGMCCAWATGRTASEGWQLCAPAARTIFVTTYCFAAFAKLNSGYADVRKSSCTVFTCFVGEGFVPAAVTGRVLALLGDRATLAILEVGLVTLEAVEIAIPPLLTFGDLRGAALVLWIFHLLLGSIAYDYSALEPPALCA